MKKNFNNLIDSIIMTIFTILEIIVYIYFVLIFKGNTQHHLLAFLIFTLLFGIPSIVCIISIILGCYGYWCIDGDVIYSKKLFSKKVCINVNDIVTINKKVISAVIFETFKIEAYNIISKDKTIKIYNHKNKNLETLISLLNEKEIHIT